MDCKVIWTDPAIEDLGEVRYIAADDPSSARRVGDDIQDRRTPSALFRCLVHHTRRSAMEAFREVLCWNYRIFYQVSSSRRTVEILTIWHGGRNEPEL
jgi:plasmid stabilization system protein ParE